MATRSRKRIPPKIEFETAATVTNADSDLANEKIPKVVKTSGRKLLQKTEIKTDVSLALDSGLKEDECTEKIKPKAKGKSSTEDGELDSKMSKFEPPNWEILLENIKQMRINKDAPVDTMGCERTMEVNVEPKVRRYQTLLSLMLSSQTKDPVTFAAMERLKSGRSLTIQKIMDMSEEELGKNIIPVGFWKKKSIYIKKATQILRSDYNDDIPNSIEGLCSLPGVGPKMAYIAMNVAWEENAGIGVDTHVHRIANRLRWTGTKETKIPEGTRKALESWLPRKIWPEFNILLVGFGQTVCLPVKPKCGSCLNKELCPYGKSELRSQGAKAKKQKKGKKGKSGNTDGHSSGSEDIEEVSKYF